LISFNSNLDYVGDYDDEEFESDDEEEPDPDYPDLYEDWEKIRNLIRIIRILMKIKKRLGTWSGLSGFWWRLAKIF
jgi:hypothetical protein